MIGRVLVIGVVVMLANCSHPTVKQAPVLAARPQSPECVLAWTPSNVPSRASSRSLADGGYRFDPDKAVPRQGASHRYTEMFTFDALAAAVRDLAPQLRECMKASDPVTPDLQYVVSVELVGDQFDAMMTVGHVTARRIAGLGSDGTPMLVPTEAEPCITQLLQRLELPAGIAPAEAQFDLRYNDCRTKAGG